jgi:hypothetical protein
VYVCSINTILDSDRVLTMSDGVVAEFDQPTRLLAQPTSIFAGMVAESLRSTVARSRSVDSASGDKVVSPVA